MRRVFEDFGKVAEITGYRSVLFERAEAYLKANRKQANIEVDVQFFDAEQIATDQHLYFATLNALQAFHSKTNISKSVAVECMLYASAKRQIQKAIRQVGVNPNSETLAAVIVGSSERQVEATLKNLSAFFGVEPDNSVLELSPQKIMKIRGAFQIGDMELQTVTKTTREAALVDLVAEHVALLATQL